MPSKNKLLAIHTGDGPRARPIQEAFKRIGIRRGRGYELVASGELETFLIGRRRYATDEAIQAFFDRRIAESKETATQRAKKVSKATQASLMSRRRARAGATEAGVGCAGGDEPEARPDREGRGLAPGAPIPAAKNFVFTNEIELGKGSVTQVELLRGLRAAPK